MSETSAPTVPNNPPKVIGYIQNYVSPFNAIYIFPITLSAILDILSPYGPFLSIAAVIAGLIFVVQYVRKKNGKGTPVKKTSLIFLLVTFLIFSASAIANFNSPNNSGVLASWSPKIKHWQDAYIVSIKEDTEAIKEQNIENGKKIDRTNLMLAQMLETFRPELEKPLVEQIQGYESLPENQKNALMLFTQKVGVNGIKRYEGLMKAANTYSADRTPENAKAVAERFNYIVKVNGKEIEDTKTKKLLMSLFLDPPTYEYLMGLSDVPGNTDLLGELHINTALPAEQRLADPLGDFIKQLQAQGTPIEQKVVIPSIENLTPITTTPTQVIQNPQVVPVQPKVVPKPKPKTVQQGKHLPYGYY